MRILLVEDEKKIATFAQQGLKEQGFQVEWVDNGDEAYAVARTEPFDVIILDIMVPGRDGLSILRNLREQKINTPVILLTARSSLNERLEGLNLGADDYLTKPFYVEELVARIRAVSRRSDGHGVSLLKLEDLTLNQVSREVHRKDRKIELSPREFALLEYLCVPLEEFTLGRRFLSTFGTMILIRRPIWLKSISSDYGKRFLMKVRPT